MISACYPKGQSFAPLDSSGQPGYRDGGFHVRLRVVENSMCGIPSAMDCLLIDCTPPQLLLRIMLQRAAEPE